MSEFTERLRRDGGNNKSLIMAAALEIERLQQLSLETRKYVDRADEARLALAALTIDDMRSLPTVELLGFENLCLGWMEKSRSELGKRVQACEENPIAANPSDGTRGER